MITQTPQNLRSLRIMETQTPKKLKPVRITKTSHPVNPLMSRFLAVY